MNNEYEITKASRDELEIYLESWAAQGRPDDSDAETMTRAMEVFRNNGPGPGPLFVNRESF